MCELEGAAIPLLPVTDALSDLDRDGDTERDLEAAPPQAGSASALFAAGPVARLHALVLDRLERASASNPLLLVLEDLHWADQSTLDLVAFLARRLRRERILIVASYRSDEVGSRPALRQLLADVATAPTAQRLDLRGLTRSEMRGQVAGILGAPPSEHLLQAVFSRSEGNPFFAEELVAVAGSGSPDGLTTTLRDTLLARVATLDASAQAAVRVAAAGGRRVHQRLLAAAAGLPEPELTNALRAAVSQHVLVARDDGFAFRHALLQEVVYDELLPGERARLHAAFGAALEDRPEVAGGTAASVTAEIAHHWLSAGDESRALAAAVRAGTEAERVGALVEAARQHKRALALWHVVADAERVAGVDEATLLARAAPAPWRFTYPTSSTSRARRPAARRPPSPTASVSRPLRPAGSVRRAPSVSARRSIVARRSSHLARICATPARGLVEGVFADGESDLASAAGGLDETRSLEAARCLAMPWRVIGRSRANAVAVVSPEARMRSSSRRRVGSAIAALRPHVARRQVRAQVGFELAASIVESLVESAGGCRETPCELFGRHAIDGQRDQDLALMRRQFVGDQVSEPTDGLLGDSAPVR